MIRFSAFLVAVAIGLLVAGVVTSKLLLVYIAIGVSGAALLALGIGAVLKRSELFGKPETAGPEVARPEPAGVRIQPRPEPQAAPWATAVPSGSGPAAAWPAATQAAPSLAGYLPAEQPVRTPSAPPRGGGTPAPAFPDPWPPDVQRPPAGFTPRPSASAPSPAASVWERQHDAPPARPPAPPAGDQAGENQPPDHDQPAGPPEPAEARQSAGPDQAVKPEQPQQAAQPQRATEPEPPATAETAQTPAPPGSSGPSPAAADPQREVTVVPGVPRYHDAHCILIRFMGEGDLKKMTLGRAREAGCTPCRACQPDQPER